MLLIVLLLLPALSAFGCAIRWGGNGILGCLAAWLILSLALNVLAVVLMSDSPMFAHAPFYARAAFVAASTSFQGIACCASGGLGGWAGLAVYRRKTKAISSKTAEVFE